jgi:3-phenylpropionate/trans-cinnamate dioxygenase ferredoxin subunit
MPFERVASLEEIPDLGRKEVLLDDEILTLLLRVGDTYYCVEDICTHDGQPLTDGQLDGLQIVCPRHGARFDVVTGRAMKMPATKPIRVFPVEVRADGIYVQSEPLA